MHRSGTSLVTRLMGAFGGRLCSSEDLLRGTEHGRRTSYFESRNVVSLNETLLRVLGGDWAAPPNLPGRWWSTSPAADLGPVARSQFWSVHPPTGWLCKDPRMCLTLPFWREWVMPNPRIVLVIRHPADVARSLARRDGMDVTHAVWLWTRYTMAALRSCEGLDVLVLMYDRLCRDPAGTALRVRRWFDGVTDIEEPGIRDVTADVGDRSHPVRPRIPEPLTCFYQAVERLHGSHQFFPAVLSASPGRRAA